ncbi:Uncharacterized protein conserved in bacteria [Veillonella criceti]|uniref:Uncharacterized protein conserved in bacteria n=1 Tax=Veillonella criceti TaxID=103891 RepID=A0A380NM56_9FIRM|nr:Uncharacterized protein conserved in bacteria [Veillonella criceti]
MTKNIIVDLNAVATFNCEDIEFSNQVNYIFGKNGTGKSTLAELVYGQFQGRYDVRIFSGFSGVISEDETLNAVILGKENIEVDNEIKKLRGEIDNLNKLVEIKITEYQNFEEEKKKLQRECDQGDRKLGRIYKEWAQKVNQQLTPPLVNSNYTAYHLKKEIECVREISVNEVTRYIEVLKAELKHASTIPTLSFNFIEILKKVNHLLGKKVEAFEVIPRLDSLEKRRFAEEGLNLHENLDTCIFCGSKIDSNEYNKLKRYFDATEVEELKQEIYYAKLELTDIVEKIEKVILKKDEFYLEYMYKVSPVIDDLENRKRKILSSLERLQRSLLEKDIFSASEQIKIPEISELVLDFTEYNKLVELNNNSSLEEKQNEARDSLRLHYLAILKKDNSEYTDLLKNNKSLKTEIEQINKKIEKSNQEYLNLKGKIEEKNLKICDLQERTISKLQLVESINKILGDNLNSFELVYQEDVGDKGHYQVKSRIDQTIRSIKELSTGEKIL